MLYAAMSYPPLRNHIDIVNLFLECTSSRDNDSKNYFITIIRSLYAHKWLKNFLDFVATKIWKQELRFVLQEKQDFSLAAGSCRTVECTQNANAAKKYVITLKKIASDVLLHEIAHMLEQELIKILDLNQFAYALMDDIKECDNPVWSQVLRQLCINELKMYAKNEYLSELFARYFQLFGSVKETAYNTAVNGDIAQLTRVLSRSTTELERQLNSGGEWKVLIYPQLALVSQQLVAVGQAANNEGNFQRKIGPEHHIAKGSNHSKWQKRAPAMLGGVWPQPGDKKEGDN